MAVLLQVNDDSPHAKLLDQLGAVASALADKPGVGVSVTTGTTLEGILKGLGYGHEKLPRRWLGIEELRAIIARYCDSPSETAGRLSLLMTALQHPANGVTFRCTLCDEICNAETLKERASRSDTRKRHMRLHWQLDVGELLALRPEDLHGARGRAMALLRLVQGALTQASD